uniref:Uncharacterized protein n=1 Tax=Escherichia coli TaxID=562 RepID=A0A7T3V7I9_ECOLX|nr:hypothetical protein [Escherichia coli]
MVQENLQTVGTSHLINIAFMSEIGKVDGSNRTGKFDD